MLISPKMKVTRPSICLFMVFIGFGGTAKKKAVNLCVIHPFFNRLRKPQIKKVNSKQITPFCTTCKKERNSRRRSLDYSSLVYSLYFFLCSLYSFLSFLPFSLFPHFSLFSLSPPHPRLPRLPGPVSLPLSSASPFASVHSLFFFPFASSCV